jgi:transposase-like protein
MFALKDLNELLDKMPLWKRMKETPDKLDELAKRVKAIEDRISGTGDVCPFCRQPKVQLLEIKPDQTFGDMGLKRGYYKCDGCGKTFDKEMKEDH